MNKIYLKLTLLSIIIILIGMIRFNRNDIGITNVTVPDAAYDKLKSNDAIRYINMTNYFRGETSPDILIPPFTTRVLIPMAASVLPFAPDTSVNIINLILTIASLIVLYKILKYLELPQGAITLGLLIFTFSFPVFYNTTTTYVDASFMFFVYLALYCMLKEKFYALILVFILGSMTKEAMIIIIPVYFLSEIFKGKKISTVLVYCYLLCMAYSLTRVILLYIRPNDLNYFPLPSMDFITNNILRPRSYISFVLSFGISGFVSVFFLVLLRKNLKELLSRYGIFFSGIAVSIIYAIYAFFSAYADGRYIWTSVPFSIPFMLILGRKYYLLYGFRINILKKFKYDHVLGMK
ncbi:MAG: hypothetical protein J0M18_18375 [Ignavibacteria bacterium]|nr:hypothetical protein [Ignavibacteria bacterium]